jgi:hypothetical protein
MREPIRISRVELEKLYHELTIKELRARLGGISISRVYHVLDSAGIPRRDIAKADPIRIIVED